MATLRTLLTGLLGLFATMSQAADPAERRPGGVGPEYEVRTFEAADGTSLRYGWLTPKHAKTPADRAGEKFPLVVCLHGRGGNSTAADVLVGPKLRDKYPCYVFVPDSGRTWWAVTQGRGEPGDAEGLPRAVEAIRALLKSEPIDPARVYVTGQSMGGHRQLGRGGPLSRSLRRRRAGLRRMVGRRCAEDVARRDLEFPRRQGCDRLGRAVAQTRRRAQAGRRQCEVHGIRRRRTRQLESSLCHA